MRLVLAWIYKSQHKRVLRTQLGYNHFSGREWKTTKYIKVQVSNLNLDFDLLSKLENCGMSIQKNPREFKLPITGRNQKIIARVWPVELLVLEVEVRILGTANAIFSGYSTFHWKLGVTFTTANFQDLFNQPKNLTILLFKCYSFQHVRKTLLVAPKDLYMVDIPCKDMADPLRKRITTMRVPMILPHELLDFLSVPWYIKTFFEFWWVFKVGWFWLKFTPLHPRNFISKIQLEPAAGEQQNQCRWVWAANLLGTLPESQGGSPSHRWTWPEPQ